MATTSTDDATELSGHTKSPMHVSFSGFGESKPEGEQLESLQQQDYKWPDGMPFSTCHGINRVGPKLAIHDFAAVFSFQ